MRKIAFTLLVALQCLTANAFEGIVEINGIYYYIITKGAVAEVVSNPAGYKGDIEIPTSVKYEEVICAVTSIGKDAFSYDKELINVTIPNTVKNIDTRAFIGCSNLKSVKIPNSVEYIGSAAFYNCEALETVSTDDIESWCSMVMAAYNSNPLVYAQNYVVGGEKIVDLVIPSSVTSVNAFSFLGFKGLKTVQISSGVTSIGEYAFYGCTELTSLIYSSSVNTIEQYAFYNCSALNNLTFSEGLTHIRKYCFSGCSSLTSVSFPNTIKTIEFYAFDGCRNLKTIRLGSGLEELEINAFGNCSEMTDVYCLAENPPIIRGYYHVSLSPFYGSHAEYATLHVPESRISSYQTSRIWNEFGSIVALTEEETGIETTSISNNDVQSYYSLDGKRLDAPQKGVNIVKMANGQTKKVVIK